MADKKVSEGFEKMIASIEVSDLARKAIEYAIKKGMSETAIRNFLVYQETHIVLQSYNNKDLLFAFKAGDFAFLADSTPNKVFFVEALEWVVEDEDFEMLKEQIDKEGEDFEEEDE